MFEQINELAVLVSAILAVAVGNVWYSPLLFGPLLAQSMGSSGDAGETSRFGIIRAIVLGILTQMVFFVLVTELIQIGKDASVQLLTIGGLILGLIATQAASLVVWERRPFMYIGMHVGYTAIIIFGGIGVLAYWPW